MANALTISRILLIIPFVYFFMINAKWNMNAALAVFVIASITDFFDGWLARARNEVSAFGAALDPIADKMIATAALFLLARNGHIASIHIIAALAIVLREFLITGLRSFVSRQGEKLEVIPLAKWKTFSQLIAIGVLIAASPNGLIGPPAQFTGICLLWIAAIISLISGGFYLHQVFNILRR